MPKNTFRDSNWLNNQKFKLTSLFKSLFPSKKSKAIEKQMLTERNENISDEKNQKNLHKGQIALANNIEPKKESALSSNTNKSVGTILSDTASTASTANENIVPEAKNPLSGIKVSSPGSGILETNLIQGEVVSFFDWRRSIIIITTFISIGIIAIAGLYGYLFIWERIKIEESKVLKKDHEKILEDIKGLKTEVKLITNFEKKLIMANILIDRHIYWSQIFEFLEKNTLSDVYYDSFGGSYDGNYKFNAHGKNFHTIAAQMELLRKNELVSEVNVSGGKVVSGRDGEDAIDFNFDVTIDPKVFLK